MYTPQYQNATEEKQTPADPSLYSLHACHIDNKLTRIGNRTRYLREEQGRLEYAEHASVLVSSDLSALQTQDRFHQADQSIPSPSASNGSLLVVPTNHPAKPSGDKIRVYENGESRRIIHAKPQQLAE